MTEMTEMSVQDMLQFCNEVLADTTSGCGLSDSIELTAIRDFLTSTTIEVIHD